MSLVVIMKSRRVCTAHRSWIPYCDTNDAAQTARPPAPALASKIKALVCRAHPCMLTVRCYVTVNNWMCSEHALSYVEDPVPFKAMRNTERRRARTRAAAPIWERINWNGHFTETCGIVVVWCYRRKRRWFITPRLERRPKLKEREVSMETCD